LYGSILKHTLTFSPDGKRIAYAAREGDKWFVVVDGKEGKRYDDILKHTPVFSPDSKRIAYAAREGNKWFVIEETTDGNKFKNIITFRAGNDDAKDSVNSNIGNQYDAIIEGSLLFSPDST
ncbi:MAG: hypothetical protein QSU88_02435, partial [Candidatus Methanoperedens sp.]|nr:hypothetical protein [Candidatus Methanoperedens sp.]